MNRDHRHIYVLPLDISRCRPGAGGARRVARMGLKDSSGALGALVLLRALRELSMRPRCRTRLPRECQTSEAVAVEQRATRARTWPAETTASRGRSRLGVLHDARS
jgi:hypothetical protein